MLHGSVNCRLLPSGNSRSKVQTLALNSSRNLAVMSPVERRVLALDDPMNDAVSSGEVQRSGFLK